jgi:hypothetical protein
MRNYLLSISILLLAFSSKAQDSTQHYTLQFTSSNIKVLSDAYLHYGSNFNDVLRAFQYDSSLFNERYNDTLYIGTTLKREYQNSNRSGEIIKSYEKLEYRNLSGKIKSFKLKGEKFFGLNFGYSKTRDEAVGDKYKIGNSETENFMAIIFPGLQNKKQLKSFLKNTEVCDHRIYYNKKTNIFELELKTTDGFIKKEFFPYYITLEAMNEIEIADFYYEQFMIYIKDLYKREHDFNKTLIKSISRIQKDQAKLLSKKWKTFQKMYMSSNERRMTMANWLEYYELIIQDEFQAVMNSEPKKGLLGRFLREVGYRNTKMDLVNGNKTLNFRSNGSIVMIKEITMVNLSRMYFCSASYSNGNSFKVNFTEGDEYAFLVYMTNGDYGVVKSNITNEETLNLEFKSIPKELVSIEMFSKKAGL